jgi:predicted carbohydrate-binding protein with CBM5 and CBM33 domain
MITSPFHFAPRAAVLALVMVLLTPSLCVGHGTVVFPASRVHRVYLANPDNPSFPLAAAAVQLDGTLSYYTWNEVSRNIPQAVTAGLPPGFDYSPWMPDGEIASAGRTDPNSPLYPRTYAGLDQVGDWPRTSLVAGETITVEFFSTAQHDPSVFDVWMTKPSWDPSMPLTWGEMEFLQRPTVTLNAATSTYEFALTVPTDRSGHHVLWVAWQRDDSAGEVFVSTSDIDIRRAPGSGEDFDLRTGINGAATLGPDLKTATLGDVITVAFESPLGSYDGTLPVLVTTVATTGASFPAVTGYPEVHVDVSNVTVLFDGALSLVVLPPGGLSFNYTVFAGLAGSSATVQAIALAPSANTGNPITLTDAHEISFF